MDNRSYDIRLIESTSTGQRPERPYAALSYCWGEENHVTTTRDSIQRHLVRINWQDLPQTLQDDIRLTESLGLGYLWVDPLCIIQDDDDDKAWEIGQMPLVYSKGNYYLSRRPGQGMSKMEC